MLFIQFKKKMNDFEAIFGWILNDFEWSYFYAIIQITLMI